MLKFLVKDTISLTFECSCTGSSFHVGKNFRIIVDKVVTCCVDTPLAGFAVLFGSFYLFNISYPVEAGATLEYVQRYVYLVNIHLATIFLYATLLLYTIIIKILFVANLSNCLAIISTIVIKSPSAESTLGSVHYHILKAVSLKKVTGTRNFTEQNIYSHC